LETAEALAKTMEILDKESATSVSLPVDVLLTQNAGKSYTHETKRTLWEEAKHTLKTGGVFMWPLLIIPFVVLGLFSRKLLQLSRGRARADWIADAAAKLEKGDKAGAREACGKKPASLALRALKSVADENPEAGREQAERGVRELLLHEVPRLERHLTTLSVLATAAPLLGLLGTVSGLIAMFQVITEHGVNDPKLLAGGIGEALIATETGLLIAIPTLLGHNFLANRVDDIVSEAEYHALRALNALWPKG
jgi:biopolymer transport protein ExbB